MGVCLGGMVGVLMMGQPNAEKIFSVKLRRWGRVIVSLAISIKYLYSYIRIIQVVELIFVPHALFHNLLLKLFSNLTAPRNQAAMKLRKQKPAFSQLNNDCK